MDMTQTLQDISAAADSGIDYYMHNGLKHCVNCRTPLQTVIKVQGKSMTVNCMCDCLSKAFEAEQERFLQQQKAEAVKRNRYGMKDPAYRNMTFDKSDVELRRESNYCTLFPKMQEMNAGIMFIGGYGAGKTFRAACIGNQLISMGYTAYMDCITSLCNTIQSQKDRQAYVDNVCRYDLLIIDDIGAERSTEYMQEMLYNLIDTRYRTQKPLIITTNLSIDDMKAARSRTYDRIFEMCGYPITVTGESRRKQIGNNKYLQLKKLLEV